MRRYRAKEEDTQTEELPQLPPPKEALLQAPHLKYV